MSTSDPWSHFGRAAGQFAPTRWSLVAAAGQGRTSEAEEALASLCQSYWYPLYAYARRHLPTAQDAQDLTQAFFVYVLEKDTLQAADPARGRFRAFLLTAFKHFLAKERERAQAHKRGGGRTVFSLNFQEGESRYDQEPVDDATPEVFFERRWALALLERTLRRLREEFTNAGKAALFECLKGALVGEGIDTPYAVLAEQLNASTQSIKVAVHRLRRRYQELLRQEIAQTVASPEEVEDELRDLFAAVRAKTRAAL